MQNLDLKNKTVFITGVDGFIGSNLAERLLKEIEGIVSLYCVKIYINLYWNDCRSKNSVSGFEKNEK